MSTDFNMIFKKYYSTLAISLAIFLKIVFLFFKVNLKKTITNK